MPHGFVLNISFHKYLLLAGVVIIALTLFWAQGRLQSFEHQLSELVEETLVASSELRSMEQRARYLEMAAAEAKAQEEDEKESTYELQKLRDEAEQIRAQNEEASRHFDELVSERKRLSPQFQIGYWGSLLSLLVGTILATVGLVFWYFRIKLVKDRRDHPRTEDV